MKEKEITNVSEMLDAIRVLAKYYPLNISPYDDVAKNFFYRGVGKKEYKLLPGLFRRIEERNGFNYNEWIEEYALLMSFIQEASAELNLELDNYIRWVEHAQHHGVPTRLLDWTANPLTALYFACKNDRCEDGIVWVLHGVNYRTFQSESCENSEIREFRNATIKQVINAALSGRELIETPLLYTPYYIDPRMSAQSSYFMAWGSNKHALEDILKDDKYQMNLPEEDTGVYVYGQEQEEAVLFRFVVRSANKQKLLRELDLIGINEKTLFPGLDGLGRYLAWKYRIERSEIVANE